MDIDVPLRELGAVDATALRAAVLAQEDAAWLESEYRQQTYHHHDQTRSIILVFTDGSNWPDSAVHRGPGWERLSALAEPLMQGIIERHYSPGGEVIRAMAALLPGGGKIKSHADVHQSFRCGHRIHVPITTNHRVWYTVDGRPYQLQVGQAYELNNQKPHSVANKGAQDRISFIFDYIPPGPLAYPPASRAQRPATAHPQPLDPLRPAAAMGAPPPPTPNRSLPSDP